MGHEATPDLYSYASGDPINLIDPDGRMSREEFQKQMIRYDPDGYRPYWGDPDASYVGKMFDAVYGVFDYAYYHIKRPTRSEMDSMREGAGHFRDEVLPEMVDFGISMLPMGNTYLKLRDRDYEGIYGTIALDVLGLVGGIGKLARVANTGRSAMKLSSVASVGRKGYGGMGGIRHSKDLALQKVPYVRNPSATKKELKVSSGVGDDFAEMVVHRNIQKGEKIADIIDEAKALTFSSGNEVALVKLANGNRALVSGGSSGITFGDGQITRIFGHTHPFHVPPTGPSAFDDQALQILGQRSSYILEHGDLIKFTAP